MKKPKFKKGDVVKHILGEKLIIISPNIHTTYPILEDTCEVCGSKWGLPYIGFFGCNNCHHKTPHKEEKKEFLFSYKCKTKDFREIDVEEKELNKIK